MLHVFMQHYVHCAGELQIHDDDDDDDEDSPRTATRAGVQQVRRRSKATRADTDQQLVFDHPHCPPPASSSVSLAYWYVAASLSVLSFAKLTQFSDRHCSDDCIYTSVSSMQTSRAPASGLDAAATVC